MILLIWAAVSFAACGETVADGPSASGGAAGPFAGSRPIEVVHPFHNSHADYMGLYATVGSVTLSPAAEAVAAELPEEVAAVAIEVLPPDSTDLTLSDENMRGELLSRATSS